MRTQKRNPTLLLIVALAAALTWAAGSAFAAETWKGVPLVDTQCASRVKSDPDAHTTKCALQCVKNGFGIYAADGTWLKLDEAGNKLAEAAVKSTKKTDHLRATVTGERQGDTIKVATLTLDEKAS
ncbi:MAG TPA: hypothetical protein VFQ07_03460 [Candidatus Polarisedimenticolia bacterium]|nr:hypothetical protein [Candidatus Polarisedimenticolia bacterium]